MFKKCIFIFFICLYTIVYADNSVGNVGNTSPKNIGEEPPLSKTIDVKYTVYNYKMTPEKFAKFLETNNLSKTVNLTSTTNIVSLNVLQKEALDTLNQKLTKEFTDKTSGSVRCIISNNLCGGSSSTQIIDNPNSKTGKQIATKQSILFKIFTKNKELSAKVISDNSISNHTTLTNLMELKSEAVIPDVKNKDYVIVSQTSKGGILYGQIIQISFSNN